jgi:hypothetical protein
MARLAESQHGGGGVGRSGWVNPSQSASHAFYFSALLELYGMADHDVSLRFENLKRSPQIGQGHGQSPRNFRIQAFAIGLEVIQNLAHGIGSFGSLSPTYRVDLVSDASDGPLLSMLPRVYGAGSMEPARFRA